MPLKKARRSRIRSTSGAARLTIIVFCFKLALVQLFDNDDAQQRTDNLKRSYM